MTDPDNDLRAQQEAEAEQAHREWGNEHRHRCHPDCPPCPVCQEIFDAESAQDGD